MALPGWLTPLRLYNLVLEYEKRKIAAPGHHWLLEELSVKNMRLVHPGQQPSEAHTLSTAVFPSGLSMRFPHEGTQVNCS